MFITKWGYKKNGGHILCGTNIACFLGIQLLHFRVN